MSEKKEKKLRKQMRLRSDFEYAKMAAEEKRAAKAYRILFFIIAIFAGLSIISNVGLWIKVLIS
jgi:hypothetical protein